MTRFTGFSGLTIFTMLAIGTAAAAGCYAAPQETGGASAGGGTSHVDGPAPNAASADRSEGDASDGGAGDSGATHGDGDAGDAGKTRDSGPVTSVCSSATFADATSQGSELMHPGKACIACHSANGAPAYTLAGTVYPTMHEPDDCNGLDGTSGITVLIIDAAGNTHTMPVDAAGNFKRVTSIPMPYRATIVSGSSIREMKSPQTDGDCNGCHSELGTRAPGRIMAP